MLRFCVFNINFLIDYTELKKAPFYSENCKMKINKNQVLEKARPLLFSLGLIISLGTTFVAFEWRSYDRKQMDVWIPIDNLIDTIAPPPIIPQILKKAAAKPNIVIEKPTAFKVTDEIWNEMLFEEKTESKPQKNNDFEYDFLDDEGQEEVIEDYVFQMPIENPKEYAYLPSCESTNHNAVKFGCTKLSIQSFVKNNFKVNTDVFESQKINVSFVIDTNGRVTNIKTNGSNNHILLNEAVRVIKSLPLFIPAKHNGVKHPMITTVPILIVTEY